ncbi:hypothetical protein ACWD0Z_30045 [Streptomyces sp. NPDC003007]
MDGPIDLVGHDWGALLSARIATTGAVPLRSWVKDVACIYHPSYVWHDLAQTWQTPEAGEAFMAHALSVPAEHPRNTATAMRGWGVPEAHARAMNARLDRTMCDAILALYRSSTPNVFADWGPTTATPHNPAWCSPPRPITSRTPSCPGRRPKSSARATSRCPRALVDAPGPRVQRPGTDHVLGLARLRSIAAPE